MSERTDDTALHVPSFSESNKTAQMLLGGSVFSDQKTFFLKKVEPVKRRRIQIGRGRPWPSVRTLTATAWFPSCLSECIRLDPARRTEEMRYHFQG